MRAARSILLIAAFLLIYMAVLFLPYIRAQDKGILVEDSDYASTIPIEMPDIPSHIIDIPPRIIVEYADFRSPFNLEAPFGISGIADFIITRVIIEYTDHIQAYELLRPLDTSSIPSVESRIIVEYADFESKLSLYEPLVELSEITKGVSQKITIEYADYVFISDIHIKPVIIDRYPPAIKSVRQEPPISSVYSCDDVLICADVIDDLSGVKYVALKYVVNGEIHLEKEMTNIRGVTYATTIPRLPSNSNVTYIIVAEDNVGNIITTKDLGHEHHYTVLPIFVRAHPKNFTITPGESVIISLSLIDLFSKPIYNRTITWIVRSETFIKTGKLVTDENGTALLSYVAEKVPFETPIEIYLIFNDIEKTIISTGKIMLNITFFSVLILCVNTLFLIGALYCIVLKTRRWRNYKNWSISRKAMIVIVLLTFSLSFFTFQPFGFWPNFADIFVKAPKLLASNMLILFVAFMLFSLITKGFKQGIKLSFAYFFGSVAGLSFPSLEVIEKLGKPEMLIQLAFLCTLSLTLSLLGGKIWPPLIEFKSISGARVIAIKGKNIILTFLKENSIIKLKCRRNTINALITKIKKGISSEDLHSSIEKVWWNERPLDTLRENFEAICFALNRYPLFRLPDLGSKDGIKRFINFKNDSINITDGTYTLSFRFKGRPNLVEIAEQLLKGDLSEKFLHYLSDIEVNSKSLTLNEYRIKKALEIWRSFKLNKDHILDLQYEFPREMREDKIADRLLTDLNALDLFVKDYELAFKNSDFNVQAKLLRALNIAEEEIKRRYGLR